MKKIMFYDTEAVLEGRKTQTRRLLHYPKTFGGKCVSGFCLCTNKQGVQFASPVDENGCEIDGSVNVLPTYRIGEEVAIAQSYFDCGYTTNARRVEIIPGHSVQFGDGSAGWNNKMFVRSDLMPHRIRIKDASLQRLQDISDDDCMKEGLEFAKGGFYVNFDKNTNSRTWLGKTCREAFAAYIDKVSGKGTWNSNPYVFVYDFELIK